MSESDEVGEIQSSREQRVCIQWKIHNYFSSILQKPDTSVRSPYFQFDNASWYLDIWPNGRRVDKSVGWIDLYLSIKESGKESKSVNTLMSYTLGIKWLDKSLRELSGVSLFTNENESWGFARVIKRSELLRMIHHSWDTGNLVPEGTLTVVCTARVETAVKGVATQTEISEGVSTLSEDLRNLFIDEKNSDVTIKVKDRRFRVHKSILGSRSSVFSAMFEHDMKENTTGTVDIDDCEPEIFHDFLLFLYTGIVEKLSSNNVEGLYYLADKYILKDLTSMCLNYMSENLDLSNACAVMAIADRHHEEELKKIAEEMIKRNLKTLIPTSQWITFYTGNPVLASELLLDVLPDNKS